jgi:hypothetical protein
MHNYFPILLKKFVSIILFTFLFSIFSSYSQSPYICSKSALAEKIYLQLDRKVYTTDEIIWFKAITTNAVTHRPTVLSGILHVELTGPNEKLIEKKLIKINDGIGNGFFQLNRSYAEGLYLVRAYTEWNKNFDADFIFNEYIQVFAPIRKEKEPPITNVTLIEKGNNQRRLNAFFNPNTIDSLQKKELTLFLSVDNRKDTLTIKRGGNNKYFLDYAIPNECQFVTLQMQTENHFNFSKTVVLNKDYLDLQFFPESGELVRGIQSLVGFKALDCNGKGKSVEGEVVNQQGEVITSFKSNQLGMGIFSLIPLDTTTKYFARILPKSDEHPQKMIPLPPIAPKGNVLLVRKNGDEIQLTAFSNYLKNDSISLSVSCRGIVHYSVNLCLKNGIQEITLPANKLPEGIVAFTMKNHSSVPVAERLFFNEKQESRINIAISTKESYQQRDSARLDIEVTNSKEEPVNASLSVLVLNKEQLGQIQNSRQNILSYFLLSSELRGEIETPGFYFRKDSNSRCDLDALMLTQGWRKYKYTNPVEKLNFEPETNLNISGTVSGLLFQKKKKVVDLTMMTFGHAPSFQTQKTDSLGRFSFDVNDQYGQNVNVLIQSANKQGVKKDYTIVLDKRESPPVVFKPVTSVESVDSVVHALVEKNIERRKIDDAFPISSGNILLDEVVVEGYRMTPERKKVTEEYGEPDRIIEGKTIEEKEEKWSYGLYSVLMFNFPDKVLITRGRDGNLYARVKNSEMTLVVIDGIPVKPYEYPFIPNIPPSEVKSFEIIENAKNFSRLYCELFPQSCLYAPVWGDVIAIYTYAGHGIYGANRAEGILKTTIPAFSASREFYAPKYDKLKSEDWFKPDLRALVHWQPNLLTDSLGKVSTTYYNADNLGKILVVVEAISENGEIGYQEMEYDVMKRQFKQNNSYP